MCVVSMVNDYYRERFPVVPAPWGNPGVVPYPRGPNPIFPTEPDDVKKNLPIKPSVEPRAPTEEEIENWIRKNKNWDLKKYNAFKKLLEDAKKLDAEMGEANCEDPLKVKWLNELEELIAHIRAKMGKTKKENIKISTRKQKATNAV